MPKVQVPAHVHHRPKPKIYYADKYWKDMPEKAHKAAASLGYTEQLWDSDEQVPYDGKTFFASTEQEKKAAMFLGMNPIDYKLQVWWSDLDQATKDAALGLGWTQETWDDDWEIEHLECNGWTWDNMTKDQQKAATHFGYTKSTWDETFDEIDFSKKPNKILSVQQPPKKQTTQTGNKPQAESTQEEQKDKFSFLDNVCCAPYKLILMPVTKLASMVAK